MNELDNSIVKTENSLVDYISVKDQKDNDFADKIEEFKHIVKWVNKKSAIAHYQPLQPNNKAISEYTFYLVKIESLSNLCFKKTHNNSKIYATIIGKLASIKSSRYFPKISRTVKVVEQINTYIYQLKEPILFYFYTSNENQVIFTLEVLLSEQQQKPETTSPVFGNFENIGCLQIDFGKQRKGKQKKLLIPANEYFQTYKQGEGSNVSPYANFLVTKSQAYKYLEKLVPQNTLCDTIDRISGILGSVLPLSENALTDFALTTDAQGLKLNFFSIQVNYNIIKDASTKAEQLVKNKHCLISKVASNVKDVLLHVYFHNGWKAVSQKLALLKQRGDHLKTNQSNFSDMAINNNKKIQVKTYENPIKLKSQFKKYECEQQIELKLVFPQEEECVLIYQIVAEVNVRGQIQNSQKKELPEIVQQNIRVPLCFAISSAKSIANQRHLASSFNLGGCLTSFNSLKQMVEINFKNISYLKRNQSKISQQSKNKIPSALIDADSVSNNKTVNNMSQISTKKIQNEIGFIDLQMRLIDKEHFQTDTNLSLPLQNISSFNISKIDIKDKIQNEKQRITKESKKNLTIAKINKLNINFLKQIIMSEHQKESIAKVIPIKKSKYNQKQNFLKILKSQISKHYLSKQQYLSKSYSNPSSKNQASDSPQQLSKRILYSIRMSRLQPQSICEQRCSKYLHYLFSNRIIHQKYYFKYQTVPLQVIKTELAQVNYNNCYFINFIQVANYTNTTLVKFPQIFYFRIKFYNHEQIRSQLMTINKDTGQILLANNQNPSSRVIHIQVNIDGESNNSILKFIQYIEFMYNGVLHVEIVDYFTGHSFGTVTIPLRNLIRKRRNEAIYTHEDLIYQRNMPKANIKVQLRAIRKMKNPIKLTSQIHEPSKQISPKNVNFKLQSEVDMRLQRIQRFKQNRDKGAQQQSELVTQASKINKIVNQAYSHQKTKIMVTYLTKQFFFIQVHNKMDTNTIYRLSINDEDTKWIQNNPLSGSQQITIVKDISKLQKRDYELLTAYKKNQQKMLKCLQVNQDEQFELGPRGKAYVLLCYLTVRRYKDWSSQKRNEEQLAIFNRERTINLSLINQSKGSIEAIYGVQVVPIPEDSTIQLQFYRGANQQSLIHLPFIDSQYLSAKVDQILIDDPYLIALAASNHHSPLIKKFASISTGIYLQLSNDIPYQSYKEFNILLLNDIKKKQNIGESRKNQKDKSRMKVQSRMVEMSDEVEGPKTIRILLRVWGCLKIQAQVALWEAKQGVFQINNQFFRSRDIRNFYLVSDDEQALRFHQNKKQKYENHELFIVQEGVNTQISYELFSSTPNKSFIYIHAISANQVLEQEQSVKRQQFIHIQPLLRIVMEIQTGIPNFKEMLRININKASQGIIQQPFTYRSSSNKKTEFKLYSSDYNLVWAKNNDSIFQLQAKAQRKLHISFNTQKIVERNSVCGGCEGVVLGIKWDKGIDYYGFKFNIY